MAHLCFHAQDATSLILCCIVQSTYHKLLKIHHLFTHYLEAKVGSVCSNIPSVWCTRPLPQVFAVFNNMYEVDNHDNRCRFWKNSSFAECVQWEISSICIATKLRGIISMWRQETTRCKLVFLGRVQATKVMAVVSERDYSNFVCTCLGTQWTTELIKSSLKACPEDIQYGAFTRGNKISM